MADAQRSIFNMKATEKLRSPDDLDKYVRVTNPSAWLVITACVAVLAGLLMWGIFGSVTSGVSCTGAVADGGALCLLSAEEVTKVHVGDQASVGGERMQIESISAAPLSRGEVRSELGSDFLVSKLMRDDWGYVVRFAGDTSDLVAFVPLEVTITVERIAPITLLLGE